MKQPITIELLNVHNWLKICGLSVSEEQKRVFPIPNLYWIGISRYEEKSELFAIRWGEQYAGLIGGGLDEDGVSGHINPLMVDKRYQRQGVAAEALGLMVDYLVKKYHVPRIHISHRKENYAASQLYERLGFSVYAKTNTEFCMHREIPHEKAGGIL